MRRESSPYDELAVVDLIDHHAGYPMATLSLDFWDSVLVDKSLTCSFVVGLPRFELGTS